MARNYPPRQATTSGRGRSTGASRSCTADSSVIVLARTSRAVAILSVLAAGLIGAAYAADLATEQRLTHLDSRLTRLEGVLGNKVLLDMLQRIESLQREL